MNLKKARETGVLKLDNEDFNDPGTLDTLMEKQHQATVGKIINIMEEYNIDNTYATCIWYLRTRKRWTIELENKLIQMYRDGIEAPNMSDWP